MDYTYGENLIEVTITPKKAVGLFFSRDISITSKWLTGSTNILVNQLKKTTVSDLLDLVDSMAYCEITSADIPQFGSTEMLRMVPIVISESGLGSMSFTQLGFNLRKDPSISTGASLKYGETHGKGAYLTGLVDIVNNRVSQTTLSYCFNNIGDENEQLEFVRKLYFRLAIVQNLLKAAKDRQINGYDYMIDLSKSTKFRRMACLKMVFEEMSKFNNEELNRRISNVYWNLEE